MNQMIRTSNVSLEPRVYLTWAGAEETCSNGTEAGFAAGAGLAALDWIIRLNPPWAGTLRHRMALSAAVATTGANGRVEDERRLRDAWLLRQPGDDPGPAGQILKAWRLLASGTDPLAAVTLHAAVSAFRIQQEQSLEEIIASIGLAKEARAPVIAAADIAARVFRLREDAEPLAFWLADAVLAKSMRWPAGLPLLACQVRHAALKDHRSRVKPGDPEWINVCCLAYARAAAQACNLASGLSRRTEKLLTAAPKLRAKDAASVVAVLLADDAVTATSFKTKMSDRALRRLFDRLVDLDAIRELSGRASFRIYGL